MNLHQYRVIQALAVDDTMTDEEQDAIKAAINGSLVHYGFCYKCQKMSPFVLLDESRSDLELKHICRECADKVE